MHLGIINYKFLFDISNEPEYLELRNYVTNYNWVAHPIAKKYYNTDPAWKDSYVIQFCVSKKMDLIQKNFNNFTKYSNITHEYDKQLENLTTKLTNFIHNKIHNTSILKSMIVALQPYGSQLPHNDPAKYHSLCHRLVIPLISDENCFTMFNNNGVENLEKVTLGHVYEMNNKVIHYSINNGDKFRSTLFIDLIPNEKQSELFD